MWFQVLATDEWALARCLELGRLGDPRENEGSVRERLAELRWLVASGRFELWMFRGFGFDLVVRFETNPKRRRPMVCFGVDGDIDPTSALDLFIHRCTAYLDQRQLDELHGLEPRELVSPLLAEVYRLAADHPAFEKRVLSEMADLRLISLRRCVSRERVVG